MNYKMVLNILSKVLLIEAFILLAPMFVGIYYGEDNLFAFLLPAIGLFAIGLPLSFIKKQDNSMYAKEGFVTVALAWILMSLAGALPFVISKEIPNYVDAVFETVSGFTTTGSTIVNDVESMSKGILFWRSFTHFIGGMGILVFILAIQPKYNSGVMHVFRAESPGPSADRLVSKLSYTARILYGIYTILTILETILLLCGGMPLFDSVVHAFGTAGTGGFSIKNSSIGAYNSAYFEIVIAVFMFIFSINFNIFYLILIGKVRKAFKSEELRCFLCIIVVAILTIAINILSLGYNFAQALRYSFFQVTSVSSTTGYVSADFDTWPALSKSILVLLMIVGACGGSTGGGIKVSRAVILVKSTFSNVRRLIHPRAVVPVKFEGELLNKDRENHVNTYFTLWLIILITCTILLCIDVDDFMVNLTATISCIGNIGPGLSNAGLEMVGPMYNFALYSPFSKILLSVVMLFGRLEIFPLLLLFNPRTWRKV